MSAFVKKMYLTHKSAWYVYAVTLLIMWVLIPYNASLQALECFRDPTAAGAMLMLIERMSVLFCLVWNVMYLGKYFAPRMAEWVFLYEKRRDVLTGMLYNTVLLIGIVTVMYLMIAHSFMSMKPFYSELLRTAFQILFFTAMLYMFSFSLRSQMLGLTACAAYFGIYALWFTEFKFGRVLFMSQKIMMISDLTPAFRFGVPAIAAMLAAGFWFQLKTQKRVLSR